MNLQQLLDAIQTEKYATQPLAAHRVAGLDEHAREHYALLLAAVLRVRATIGQSQSRVFAMLLTAMGLDGRQAALFERVQAMNGQDLGECRRQIEEHGLARSFLLDALILTRLEAPLDDDELRLCAELADLLRVDADTMADLAALALQVLGIEPVQAFPKTLDTGDCPHWLEFIYQEVTADKLAAGLAPGLWLLKRSIDMDTGWSLADVTLLFADGARLNTRSALQAKVAIKNCWLLKPVMKFERETLTFTMENCTVEGNYSGDSRLTAFKFDCIGSASITNTSFSTQNARAVHAQFTPLEFQRCQFKDCGNRQLVGGALAVRTARKRDDAIFDFKLRNCQFIGCTARLGGAVRLDRLGYDKTTITGCLFDDCSATEPGMNYAVYTRELVPGSRFIQQSQFKRGGFYLSSDTSKSYIPFSGFGSSYYVFDQMELTNAKLHAKMSYESQASQFKDGVTLTGNSEIRTDVEHKLPAWAEDY